MAVRSGLLEDKLDPWDTRLCYLIGWNRSGSGGKWCTCWTVGGSGALVGEVAGLTHACARVRCGPQRHACGLVAGRHSLAILDAEKYSAACNRRHGVLALSSTHPCESSAYALVQTRNNIGIRAASNASARNNIATRRHVVPELLCLPSRLPQGVRVP